MQGLETDFVAYAKEATSARGELKSQTKGNWCRSGERLRDVRLIALESMFCFPA